MQKTLSLFSQRLSIHSKLVDEECEAVVNLPGRRETLKAHAVIAEGNEHSASTILVLDGFCARVEMPVEGRRQITGIFIAGDMPDLGMVFRPQAGGTLEAMTQAAILRIPHQDMRMLMKRFPALTEAFARQIAADSAVAVEWLTSLGSRNGVGRVAHLVCEIATRMGKVNGNVFSCPFPIKQQQVGEACGLSTVHVNRSLMVLRKLELVTIEKGVAQVRDWSGLMQAADFTDDYLIAQAPLRYWN
ncbi:MAG: Crp/Fnr family transcriptional regulator [Alphaproteobacteria bacterium]|nr:Crp/Fnr family transcriptional regulator [Alphaproteobacteria bacterium]